MLEKNWMIFKITSPLVLKRNSGLFEKLLKRASPFGEHGAFFGVFRDPKETLCKVSALTLFSYENVIRLDYMMRAK